MLTTLLRDEKARNNALQVTVLAVVVGVLAALVLTTYHNLNEQGITSGFGFLERGTGWDIPFALLDYSIRDPYWRVLLIGFLNTLYIGVFSLVFATLFGVLIGIARISANPLLRALATLYVEIFRNIPLILQAFFWYALATHLPPPRRAYELWDSVFLSSRGVFLPGFNIAPPWVMAWIVASLVLVVLAIVWRAHVPGRGIAKVLLPVGALMGLAAAILSLAVPEGAPLVQSPELKGLRFVGGLRLIPEFTALSMSIVVFGSAYIGEIVRGGFNAVDRGQLECARALGLRPWVVMVHIHIPLALRSIVPPLGNMYVWLMKATTLGIAIGFSDLFMIVSTSINQSGQTIELLGLMMLGFFIINYSISALMNWLNRSIALKGHEVKRTAGAEI
jgi:general L-amino acid transport system permease protein